jgi:hypothetical protein
MFLRCHQRKKNGKTHRYWSVVENRRLGGGRSAQRQVLYLGEINDSQQAAWRKTLAVFDESKGVYQQLSLFPGDRPIPADALNAIGIDLTGMKLRRARSFGDCWLGMELWKQLGLDRFWRRRLGGERGVVDWSKVLAILAVNRLCEPGSEFAAHRLAAQANTSLENIGARRLMTIVEKVFEEINFDAPDMAEKGQKQVSITADFVREQVAEIVKDEDLGKFVL